MRHFVVSSDPTTSSFVKSALRSIEKMYIDEYGVTLRITLPVTSSLRISLAKVASPDGI